MKYIKSIRPFVGAKNYDLSRDFYTNLGFTKSVIADNLSYFSEGDFGFYLQDYYLKEWVDNTMIFVEVDDIEAFYVDLESLELTLKYRTARLTPIREFDWGRECYLHDPSGVLWHFGEFKQ